MLLLDSFSVEYCECSNKYRLDHIRASRICIISMNKKNWIKAITGTVNLLAAEEVRYNIAHYI